MKLHGSNKRDLSLFTLNIRYFRLIVKLVMNRILSNIRDNFIFSNDFINNIKLLLYIIYTTNIIIMTKIIFVNIKTFLKN